jgi:hypothetical protein
MQHEEDEPEIEFSPLCREVSRGEITVIVQIYRLSGKNDQWTLEVVNEENTSTVWNEPFETDADAYKEFERTLAAEGIESFIADDPPPTRH